MWLTIDKTWDGQPISNGESIRMNIHVVEEHLVIDLAAPFHDDSPPEGPPGPTPGLWEYEVVELFIAGPGEQYLEIELGPYGHHLVLQLDGIRTVVSEGLDLHYSARIRNHGWNGLAKIPLAWLPEGPHRINAYAIHGPPDARRYLCWAPVPGDHPDFHRLGCFRPVQWSNG